MKKATRKIQTKSTKAKVNEAIALHKKMSGAYFYSPPSAASARRSYEKYNSTEFSFRFEGRKYEVEMVTDCSCKNVYYKARIHVDGIQKNIRALKSIV